MRTLLQLFKFIFAASIMIFLSSCANVQTADGRSTHQFASDYSSRVPKQIDTGGTKMVLVDPNSHAWGAYAPDGHLIRAGIATAGGSTCPPDTDETNCRTSSGVHKIYAMQGSECYSKTYPRPTGGGLMPYCMYFSNGQALHGSPDSIVVDDNISHGCVRMRIPDAEWMMHNFAQIGTKVKVLPYNQ